ncbi:beta-1,6-N-acetylglucosaminyltransferase [Saccharicrinis aurantiacus]|uniref:beta-1,6-N-acetylglucosaminyltransferase n=1 Tax=Saccharicrinis aurantiacus TaxID=1849719 RepID=UPI00094FF309|nr:beta-1,6-N-acetylglucosaminyltransferase [Saccharicrinis aurantiacus]
MKKNYIVLTHKNQEHIRRIIDILDDGESHFYVHIDKRKPLSEFTLLNLPCVTIIEERVHCYWADFSLVQGTVNCIKQIVKDKRLYRTILFSGQCYPIKNKEAINTLFEGDENDYITIEPIEKKWPTSYFKRIEDYKFILSQKRGDNMVVPYIFNFNRNPFKTFAKYCILAYTAVRYGELAPIKHFFKTFRKRKNPVIKTYAGHQWWAFKGDTIKRINDYIINHPEYSEYHTYSVCPDEMFFQTILMELKQQHSDIITKPTLTYVNWDRKGCNLPVTFETPDVDLEEVMDAADKGYIFSRKFVPESPILDLIDSRAKHKKMR